MAAKAKDVDWSGVERDYRAGVLVNVAIGKKYGISHTAVQKRAKAESWARDLSKRIDAAREAKVSRSIVSAKVSKQRSATDAQVVQANADIQTNLILAHRKDIGAARAIVNDMLGELGLLGEPTVQEGLRLLALGQATEKGGVEAIKAMLKALDAAVSLPGRAVTVQKLANALTSLVDKERQAFGIDKSGEGPQSLGEFLESLR